MKKQIILGVLCAVSLQAFALQAVRVTPHGVSKARVSKGGMTQIGVLGDRIEQVRGVDGEYTSAIDENLGLVFLSTPRAKPFRVYLTTKGGRSISLDLTPTAGLTDPITLLPSGVSRRVQDTSGRAAPYEAGLIAWVRAMATGSGLPDVLITHYGRHRHWQRLGHVGKARLIRRYRRGNGREGLVYRVWNTTKRPIRFRDQLLDGPGVLAIALGNKRVLPGHSTAVFVVRAVGGSL